MSRIAGLVMCSLFAMEMVYGQSSGRVIVPANSDVPASYSLATRAGHLIYTSALQSPRDGDINQQTADVFATLNETLKRAGSSLEDVVSATVTLRRAEDLPKVDETFRARFKTAPPARTVLIGELSHPTALIQIQAVSVPAGGTRREIIPPGWPTSASPESYAILADDTLFLSGLVAREPGTGQLGGGDAGSQVKRIMDNAGAILKAAGMNYDDVVSGRITVRDIATFNAVNTVYREYWQKDRPSRATVQGIIPGGSDVAMTFVAVSGGSREVIVPPRADGSPGVVGPNLSPAIRIGNRLFISGNTGSTEENRGDVAKQTAEVLTRIGRTLAAAGFAHGDVVYSEIWMTEMGRVREMERSLVPVFRVNPPAQFVVGIPALAGRTALVEIAALAVK